MALSAEQKALLKARYDAWGLDVVRQHLERNDHEALAPADVVAFAHAWIADQEIRYRRTIHMIKVLSFLFIAAFGGMTAAFLVL